MLPIKRLVVAFTTNQAKKIKVILMRGLFQIVCSFIFFQSTLGQNPGLINYSIREGLPSAEIYEVFQDSGGFIWFATDHGVAKFDGYEMKILTVKDGLTDPAVFGFTEDAKQRIWFRTYSGKLSVYENGKIKAYKWNNQLEELIQNNIMYCLQPYEDELLFSTESYIGKINSDGKIEKEEIKKNELTIKITSDKKLLYGFNGNSRFIKNIKINEQTYPIELSDTVNHNRVIAAFQDGDKTTITINSDIFSFNGNELKKVFTGRASIISLSKDREGFFWVGYSNEGADKLGSQFNLFDSPEILSKKSITKVLHDHEGGMWFTTLEEGAYYASNLKTITINLIDKTRFATFSSNVAVIGDRKGYVTTYDVKTARIIWEKDFMSPIRSLFIDPLNQLWVSTSNNTSLVDIRTGKLKQEINGSYTSYSVGSDSTLWAVGGLRISHFELNGKENFIISNSIHLKLLSDTSKLYAAGRIGLAIYDTALNLIDKPVALSNSKITSIIPFEDDLIFIGTIGNGFHLMNKKDFTITSFNTDKNFIANDVYFTQKMDSLVWISTEKGLVALKYEALKENQIQFHKTISEDFPYERINFFQVTDHSIWAVSDNAIKIIPNPNETNKTNPIFYYELVPPKEPNANRKIQITNKGSIRVKFGFISFNNQNIYARYRISPNNNWTETNSRTINLQSISPGNYSLDIQFSLDNENWKNGTSLPFLVQPQWWNTWYFLLTAALIITFIGISIFRRRFSRYEEKNRYLTLANEQQKQLLRAEIKATERERSRIAKDLHDGIGMDLVSIKFLTNQLAKKSEDKNAQEIQSQLQKTISEIKNIIYGLTPSGLQLFGLSHGLDNYLSMVKRKHSIDINLVYQGEEVKNEQMGTMVFRIIQELVTNSIKHSNCKTIAIDFIVSSTSIQITYQDNGTGFIPDTIKTGLGLSNIRSRVESVDGQISVESNSAGTTYSINLPLSKQ